MSHVGNIKNLTPISAKASELAGICKRTSRAFINAESDKTNYSLNDSQIESLTDNYEFEEIQTAFDALKRAWEDVSIIPVPDDDDI